jgi:hypothetical protein
MDTSMIKDEASSIPCPYVVSTREGTHHCSLSQQKPLTVGQLREHWQVAKVLDMTEAEIGFADYVLIARDVEALYGIKGEA